MNLSNLYIDRSQKRILGLAVCMAALSYPAYGQVSQDGASRAKAEPSYTSRLEEVTVTARRRQESALDIPVSVSALSGEHISRYDLSDLEKVAASFPQMSIARASNGSGAQIAIRGIGSSFTSIGVEQSVATIIDGVYYAQGRVINEGLYDLQQIEILKGPQALFFGKNATAGVISVTTAKPTKEFEASVKVGYEFKAEEWSGDGVISGPISDTLGYRIAVRAKTQRDSYVTNKASAVTPGFFDVATGDTNFYTADPADSSPGQELFAGRATLLWEPTESFSASLQASITRDRHDNPAWNYITHQCPSSYSSLAPEQPCKRKFTHYMNNIPREIASVMPFANKNGDLGNEWDSESFTATLNYDTDWASFTSVTNWHTNENIFVIDADYVSSPGTFIATTEKAEFEAFSTEGRMLTQFEGPVNFLFGLYYQETDLDVRQFVMSNLMNSSLPPHMRYVGWDKDSNTKGETRSAYTQLMWEITPAIELSAGVRYTHETKDSYFNQPLVNPAMMGLVVEGHPFNVDQTFENFTPEATLSWKPTDGLMLYAAYKEGYKSGGFSNTAIFSTVSREEDFAFEPEEVKGFEVGAKGMTLDGQLRYSLVLYTYEYTDLQIDFFNASTLAFITTNAGSAETEGVELELDYAPHAIPGLTLRGSVNYNEARYKDYLAPCFGGQTIAAGCTMEQFGVPHQDLSGSATSVAPRWTSSFGVNYELNLIDGYVINIDMDAKYSDSYLASSFGDPASSEKSYTYVNAALQLRPVSDRWEIALVGRNLTDKFVSMGGHDTVGTGSGTGTPQGVPSDLYGLVGFPRTIQLQATMRF